MYACVHLCPCATRSSCTYKLTQSSQAYKISPVRLTNAIQSDLQTQSSQTYKLSPVRPTHSIHCYPVTQDYKLNPVRPTNSIQSDLQTQSSQTYKLGPVRPTNSVQSNDPVRHTNSFSQTYKLNPVTPKNPIQSNNPVLPTNSIQSDLQTQSNRTIQLDIQTHPVSPTNTNSIHSDLQTQSSQTYKLSPIKPNPVRPTPTNSSSQTYKLNPIKLNPVKTNSSSHTYKQFNKTQASQIYKLDSNRYRWDIPQQARKVALNLSASIPRYIDERVKRKQLVLYSQSKALVTPRPSPPHTDSWLDLAFISKHASWLWKQNKTNNSRNKKPRAKQGMEKARLKA